MKAIKKLKNKKKKIIVIAIIIIILIKIVMGSNKEAEISDKPEIESIEKRDIATSISATGKITTENTQNVVSTLTGLEIATVPVKEGDIVAVGDVICTFDMNKVKNSLSDAKSTANISNQQANLSIEAAQRNLNQAIANKDTELAGVRTAMQTAEQAYVNAQNRFSTTSAEITAKQAELDTLNATYAQIQTELNTLPETSPEYTERKQKLTQMEIQKANLMAKITELQGILSPLQSTLNELKGAYEAAVSNYNTAAVSIDSNIASMQDNVKNAELSAASASIAQKEQVSTYEEQLQKGIVTATTAGTVTSVHVKVGDLYTGSTIATINGINQFIIQAEIDEYNIPDITVGMDVLIKTDATREEELQGKVTYVAQTASTSNLETATTQVVTGNNATYTIKIDITTPSDRLRLGMNAKLSIVTNMAKAVWAVPYDCVHEREDGTKYIEVAKNETGEEKEEIEVEKGIEGSYYVEIKSAQLQEGMKVILPQVEAGNSVDELIMSMGPGAGM